MPTNKNAVTRYKILDELLSNRYHSYSLDDLTNCVNERLSDLYPDTNGVSRRTIEKDLFYLENDGPFMVVIERYSVDGYNYDKQRSVIKKCLRYQNPAFSIFKKQMTSDEEYLLKEALSLLGQFDSLPNLDGLERLRLGFGMQKTSNRHIISFTKNPLENNNLFGELFTSISQKQVIDLKYHTFSSPDNKLNTKLHPYLLKEYNRRWYLFGATTEDGKLLNFSLDRIDNVKSLPSEEYIPYEGDINECFEDIVGVTLHTDSPLYKIIFWVSDFSKDFVDTKPIHESQRSISTQVTEQIRKDYPKLLGGKFYRIDCRYNYELIRELTSFGEDLIVLEPSAIKDMVSKRVEKLYERYQNIGT